MKTERGIILIQVLLVFALVAIIASSLLYRQATQFGRQQALDGWTQRQAWLSSGEQLALSMLATNPDDIEYDQWLGPFELERADGLPNDGELSLVITDLSGRLNVNWLRPDHPSFESSRAGLEQITSGLENDAGNLLIDLTMWLDPNSAAAFTYERFRPAYSHAGVAMADASELLLVDGIGRLLWREITPHLAFLPETSQLNINAVSPELWQAMMPRVEWEWVESLGEAGNRSLTALAQHERVAPIVAELPQYLLTDRMQYARVVVIIDQEGRSYYQTSIINLLDPQAPKIIRRSYALDEPLPEPDLF